MAEKRITVAKACRQYAVTPREIEAALLAGTVRGNTDSVVEADVKKLAKMQRKRALEAQYDSAIPGVPPGWRPPTTITVVPPHLRPSYVAPEDPKPAPEPGLSPPDFPVWCPAAEMVPVIRRKIEGDEDAQARHRVLETSNFLDSEVGRRFLRALADGRVNPVTLRPMSGPQPTRQPGLLTRFLLAFL